jgi:hypothetical protein
MQITEVHYSLLWFLSGVPDISPPLIATQLCTAVNRIGPLWTLETYEISSSSEFKVINYCEDCPAPNSLVGDVPVLTEN